MHRLRFRDRADAGRKLAAELRARKLGLAGWGPTVLGKDPIVLALARGGVPVGLEIAEALQAPLDVMVVCKLSVPAQPELAMGALAHGIRVVDRVLTAALGISHQEVEWIAAKETLELERREREYRPGRPEPSLVGRTVILADDGLATGSTMVAAARHARSAGAHRLIVARRSAPPKPVSVSKAKPIIAPAWPWRNRFTPWANGTPIFGKSATQRFTRFWTEFTAGWGSPETLAPF